MALLKKMAFMLGLTMQLATIHHSLAYNFYPMPVNWEPLVVLNYTPDSSHNIASLLTGDSLVPNAAKCVLLLNNDLNSSQVCKRQLYDWLKFELDNAFRGETGKDSQRWAFVQMYVKFTLSCYFRLACVHCPAEQVADYRKAVKDWFSLYSCNDMGCTHEAWHPPRLTECADPPMAELAQCDAALEQANATDKCTAQVQLKLNRNKENLTRRVMCDAEYEDRMCMVGQVCQHCQHVAKYFEYWNKIVDPAFDECWRLTDDIYQPKRVCPVDYTSVIVIVVVVVAFLIIPLVVIICCRRTRNSTLRDTFSLKRSRKYGRVGTSRSSSKSRTTRGPSSSSSSVKAK